MTFLSAELPMLESAETNLARCTARFQTSLSSLEPLTITRKSDRTETRSPASSTVRNAPFAPNRGIYYTSLTDPRTEGILMQKPRNIMYKTPFAHAFEPKHLSTGSLAYIVGLNLLIFRIFAP